MHKLDTTLYLVTNSDGLSQERFLHILSEALAGGVSLVQLREKERCGLDYYELALKVKALTDSFGVPLIIDDRVDVALAVDAAGVHVGREDLPVDIARRLMGPGKIIGATAKTVEQAQHAQAAGADYLGVGAIYPTKTKVKTIRTSVETLKDILRHVNIPAVAIGGLDAENLEILHGSGANGIAVVRAIMESANPRESAQTLRQLALAHIVPGKLVNIVTG